MFNPAFSLHLMMRCPTCDRTYPDAARFCEHDGTALVAADGPAAGAALGAFRALHGDTDAVEPGARARTRRLPNLSPNAAHGTGPLAPEAYAGGYAPTGALTPPRSQTGARVAVGLLVLVALVLTGIGGYLFIQNRNAEASVAEIVTGFETALAQGNLVEPEGESAYDLYTRLEGAFPGSPELGPLKARVLPELQQRLDGFYDRWVQTSSADDSEWPTVRRMAEWASGMAPESGRIRAQHLYADARNAFENGNTEDAETQYQAAIAAWPEWALPYNSMGVLMARRKDFRAAAGWYEQAASRSGNWAFPHKNLGGTYTRLGRYADAERALERASDLRDGFGEAWANLSNAYIRRDRYDDARRTAQRALNEGGTGFDRQRMSDRVGYLTLYLQGYDEYYGYQEFIDLYDEGLLYD